LVHPAETAELPVDRIADLLALDPGVTSLDRGDLSVRGAGPDALVNYLDGVSVTPGHRLSSALLGGSYYGETGSGIGVGTNQFDRITLYRGLGPAEFGGARGGAIAVSTEARCRTNRLSGGLATDALFGKTNGLGFNRVTVAGNRRVGRFSVGGAAVVEGLSSERLGLEQNRSPIFVTAGIDTSITLDPGGGPVTVDVARFKESEGIRIPNSASSAYTLGANVGLEVAPGHEVRLSGYASQLQDRIFDYNSLYNPRQASAERSWSRALTGSWRGRLRSGEGLSLNGEAYLSWQTDRLTQGALSAGGEKDTRDPFGGFMLAPVDFRFDTDNFAVNDELVRNFRTNTGRRSPYDLDNTTQYSLVDQYRNNAYGLTGFTEGGGPTGQLTLSKENRLVGKGVLEARLRERHRVRVGLQLTRYDIDFYQSSLVSQLQSNAYIESPTSAAVFADYSLSLGLVDVDAGVRYDRFKSGAERPAFPRISSAPGFDPANPTAGFIADQAHGRISPRARGTFRAMPRLTVSAGVGGLASIPNFAAVLAGINTDLSTTTTSQFYGSDLGFETATVFDLGGRYELTPDLDAEATLWHRKDDDIVTARFVSEFDPLIASNRDLLRYRNDGSLSSTGLDLRFSKRLGQKGSAWLGYSYVSSTQEISNPSGSSFKNPVADARPHTVTGAVLYQTGGENRLLGGALRDVGVYAAARLASGTAYTRCPANVPEDDDVMSGEVCSRNLLGEINGSRLPTLKLVDLRLTKSIGVGGSRIVAFADARNLLNTRGVTRVFAQTGTTSNSAERLKIRAGNLDEFANEAGANGARQGDGTIDLSFGGVTNPRAACGSWTNAAGTPSVPNCMYLIGAEERWGNGDHLFSPAEQTRASDALYNVARGLQNFTGPGRRLRIGLELRL
jgi:hypothetical protein